MRDYLFALMLMVLVAIMLLAGCDGQGVILVTATPMIATDAPVATTQVIATLTPVVCFGFDPTQDDIISDNYCLDGPFTVDADVSILQTVPDRFEIVNILETIDGYPDEYTDRARIECDRHSCEFRLNNGVNGIDGSWGFSQIIDVEPGCKLIKASGHAWVNDPPNEVNYAILVYVNDDLIERVGINQQGDFEIIVPILIRQNGAIKFSVLVSVAYATPGHNSNLELFGAGMLDVDNDYCNDAPEI